MPTTCTARSEVYSPLLFQTDSTFEDHHRRWELATVFKLEGSLLRTGASSSSFLKSIFYWALHHKSFSILRHLKENVRGAGADCVRGLELEQRWELSLPAKRGRARWFWIKTTNFYNCSKEQTFQEVSTITIGQQANQPPSATLYTPVHLKPLPQELLYLHSWHFHLKTR